MKFIKKYNEYLVEVSKDIKDLTNKIKSLKINLEPYDDLRQIDVDGIIKMEYEVMEDQVYIEHIEVNKDYRKLGLSKLLLTKFLKETDRKNLPVTLMVYPTDDTTEEQLISIYKKFGFEVYGKDAGNNRPLMRREVITESSTKRFRVPDDIREINVQRNLDISKEHGVETSGEFMKLYHGTSNSNVKKINKSNRFNQWTWFAEDIDTAKLYATRNHGKKSTVLSVWLYAGSILGGSDGYWSSQEDLYNENGKYIPKDLIGTF